MGLGIGTSTFMSVFYLAGTVITHDKLNNVVQGIIWAPAVATVFGVAAKGVQMAKLSIQRRKMDSILSEEDVEYLEGLKHFYNMMDDNTNEKNGYRDFFVDFLHKVPLPDDEEKSKELLCEMGKTYFCTKKQNTYYLHDSYESFLKSCINFYPDYEDNPFLKNLFDLEFGSDYTPMVVGNSIVYSKKIKA